MNAIREYLIDQLGQDCFESNSVFKLEIPFEKGSCEAVFDPYNHRLKLFGISGRDFRKGNISAVLTGSKCVSGAYSKLIVYAYPGDNDIWHRHGFTMEGTIIGFFADSSDAVIWSVYQDSKREKNPLQIEHGKKMETARSKNTVKPSLRKGYSCKLVEEGDSTEVSNLLKKTFKEYPSPISSRRIKALIRTERTLFRCVSNRDGKIVAAASAEIDHERKNAELTDCATSKNERGKGFMVYILAELEKDLEEIYRITDVYTLARAGEQSINNSFAKLGYIYTGRLFNNCRMPDGWESMNIWCRPTKDK
jgi:putative beta-lysine N-acetyltransferase